MTFDQIPVLRIVGRGNGFGGPGDEIGDHRVDRDAGPGDLVYGIMIFGMARSVSGPVPGSVGVVETRYLELPAGVRLDCGATVAPLQVAYETYGTLSPDRDNVILVCHALSGDAHAAGQAAVPSSESTRDGFRAEERDGAAGRGLGWWD